MNGAESLIRTLVAGGVEACFTNPGTSEMHLVAALDRVTEMRCVLGLFEGVVTGAADGFARMTGKPACTLLHLGPGFANGLANLHNARRAHVPIVNLVGQHATYHLRHDTPLTADIEAFARPYSKWLRTSCSASEISHDAAEAISEWSTPFGMTDDQWWRIRGQAKAVRDAIDADIVAPLLTDSATSLRELLRQFV